MKRLHYSIVAILLLFVTGVYAAESAQTFLANTSSQMISALKKNKSQLRDNPKVAHGIARRVLLPHVDLSYMTRSVIGRPYWGEATGAQKSEFKKEFTELLIRTYASAFAEYEDEKVKIMPVRVGANATFVNAQTMILRNNGPSIPVNYSLVRSGESWKVRDFSVEGVSMVRSFRSQFSGTLGNGGMNALLQKLKKHNQNGA